MGTPTACRLAGFRRGGRTATQPTGLWSLLFVDLMIKLRLEGKLSAKSVCLLAHWAHGVGDVGPCGSIAMALGSPSGHYHRKLDKYLGIAHDKKDLYWLSLPGKEKCDASRCVLQHPVRP